MYLVLLREHPSSLSGCPVYPSLHTQIVLSTLSVSRATSRRHSAFGPHAVSPHSESSPSSAAAQSTSTQQPSSSTGLSTHSGSSYTIFAKYFSSPPKIFTLLS